MLLDRLDYIVDHSSYGAGWPERPSRGAEAQLLVLHAGGPLDHRHAPPHRRRPHHGRGRLSARRQHVARHASRHRRQRGATSRPRSSAGCAARTPPSCIAIRCRIRFCRCSRPDGSGRRYSAANTPSDDDRRAHPCPRSPPRFQEGSTGRSCCRAPFRPARGSGSRRPTKRLSLTDVPSSQLLMVSLPARVSQVVRSSRGLVVPADGGPPGEGSVGGVCPGGVAPAGGCGLAAGGSAVGPGP